MIIITRLALFLVLALALVQRQVVQGFCIAPKQSRTLPPTTLLRGSTNENNTPALVSLEVNDTTEGTGEVAAFGSIVTVKYTGSLYSEPSSDKRNQQQQQPVLPPFDQSKISFKLGYGKVLDGCDEGIRGMRVGGVRTLNIPSELGFGPGGFGPEPYSIPPNADLRYTVELTAVASGPVAEAAARMGIGLDPDTVY